MSTNTRFVVMDQYADQASRGESSIARSGLAHAQLPVAQGSSVTDCGVILIEQPLTGLLMLRATTDASSLSDALRSRCGIALSGRLRSDTKGAYCVRWMSPDAWILSCPLDEVYDIEASLRNGAPGHCALVNLSGGYTCFELTGKNARNVLMKSTGYDVHPDHLGQGKVVNTTFAKTQVTLRAIEINGSQERYELLIRRSFSDYLWVWLQRAASEYGLHAVTAAD